MSKLPNIDLTKKRYEDFQNIVQSSKDVLDKKIKSNSYQTPNDLLSDYLTIRSEIDSELIRCFGEATHAKEKADHLFSLYLLLHEFDEWFLMKFHSRLIWSEI